MSKRPCPHCGDPMDRNSRRCMACSNYGRKRRLDSNGYISVWRPGHPTARSDGYAFEHRLVLHEHGIEVAPGQHVHHINGDPTDNRIENLQVLAPIDHARLHARQRGFVRNQFGVFPPIRDEADRRERARIRNARRYSKAGS